MNVMFDNRFYSDFMYSELRLNWIKNFLGKQTYRKKCLIIFEISKRRHLNKHDTGQMAIIENLTHVR